MVPGTTSSRHFSAIWSLIIHKRADLLALALGLTAAFASYLVAVRIYDRMPHIEDEIAFVWQAEVAARGSLTVPSPPHSKHFLVPFVVDFQGQRFGKYPPGWPAMLSLGVRLGVREWVNSLLAALGVWLTYRLGARLFGKLVGLLSAVLTLVSPFFLMNSGSLLSHPMGLMLSAAFALAWLESFEPRDDTPGNRLAPYTATLSLGLLALTRPLTAVAVGLPFAIHGLILLAIGDWATRRRLIGIGLGVGAMALLHMLWQLAVTGDPLLNPYTLWWPYDRVGFGPGIGRMESGHNLALALMNTRFSLEAGLKDLFGWGPFSWIFLPFGLWAARRNWKALLVSSVFLSLVGVYMLYWVGSWVYGPRYYYEGLFSLTILSAAGIAYLAGFPLSPGIPFPHNRGWRRARPLTVTAVLALLLCVSVLLYGPVRLGGMRGLNGFSREHLAPFLSPEARQLTPALVVVHPEYWTAYGTLLELEDPFLETPFIFAITRGPQEDNELARDFPGRNILHYYPDEPFVLYRSAE